MDIGGNELDSCNSKIYGHILENIRNFCENEVVVTISSKYTLFVEEIEET